MAEVSGALWVHPDHLIPGHPTAALSFAVYGKPVGQGSKRALVHKYTGRAVTMESGREKLVPWREAVKHAARAAVPEEYWLPIQGPITVALVVTFAKPTSAPKRRRTWPITRSTYDIDKIQRGVFDALTDAGIWRDDAQVVDVRARKVYVGEDPEALDAPGARIGVAPVGGER